MPSATPTQIEAGVGLSGATHPHLRKREGERYRDELRALAKDLGIPIRSFFAIVSSALRSPYSMQPFPFRIFARATKQLTIARALIVATMLQRTSAGEAHNTEELSCRYTAFLWIALHLDIGRFRKCQLSS